MLNFHGLPRTRNFLKPIHMYSTCICKVIPVEQGCMFIHVHMVPATCTCILGVIVCMPLWWIVWLERERDRRREGGRERESERDGERQGDREKERREEKGRGKSCVSLNFCAMTVQNT